MYTFKDRVIQNQGWKIHISATMENSQEILYVISELLINNWYAEYQRKAGLLNIALENYNNGRMKRYLCELFINNDIEKIELIMKQASLLKGSRKEVSLKFKDLVKSILEKD